MYKKKSHRKAYCLPVTGTRSTGWSPRFWLSLMRPVFVEFSTGMQWESRHSHHRRKEEIENTCFIITTLAWSSHENWTFIPYICLMFIIIIIIKQYWLYCCSDKSHALSSATVQVFGLSPLAIWNRGSVLLTDSSWAANPLCVCDLGDFYLPYISRMPVERSSRF